MLKMMELLLMMIFIMVSVAFFSLFERKFLSLIQSRKGPNKVGLGGILQPFSDAMKLLSKVENHPFSSVKFLYYLSPLMIFCLSLFVWILFPSFFSIYSPVVGILILLVFFSLSVYGLVFSGWFSNSKFATIGGGRALAQSISYEIGLTTAIILYCLLFSSFFFEGYLLMQEESTFFLALFPIFLVLFVFLLAEVSRPPFDLPEGESELVSGYCVEYGGLSYTLIFLGENLSFLWIGVFLKCLFFPLGELMVIFMVFLLVWIRSSVPRMRFDKVMMFFWEFLLPITLLGGVYYCMIWFY